MLVIKERAGRFLEVSRGRFLSLFFSYCFFFLSGCHLKKNYFFFFFLEEEIYGPFCAPRCGPGWGGRQW